MSTPPRPCRKCDQSHVTRDGNQACSGHRKDGQGCKKDPLDGLKVCRYHGGNAPHARAAGRRRVAQAKATLMMAKFAGPIVIGPHESLLSTVHWTSGFVEYLRGIVAELTAGELGWGVTQEKTGGQDWGTTEKAGSNVYVTLLAEWTQILAKACALAISGGVEERRVALAEQQGAMVADVIKRVLDELGLNDEQRARSGEVVVKHLRLLTA